jgi:phage terminase large subunit-like protein
MQAAARAPNFGRVLASNRDGLLEGFAQIRAMRNEWIRRCILEGDRLDMLAELILGYQVHPNIHRRIILHQFRRKHSLILAFRNGGKTKLGTITKIIHLILKHRDIKILIASKKAGNAQAMLKEIKGHFESNERLREIFGDYVGTNTWSEEAIEVKGIRMRTVTPTVLTIGVLGALPSHHFDVIICDDLIELANSLTPGQREKIHAWYYTVMRPALNPATPEQPWAGQLHVIGTRYHHEDLYGHLLINEMKDAALIIRALEPDPVTSEEQSPWPERFPVALLQAMREEMGPLAWNSQMQCDTELMKGKIFRFDDCLRANPEDVPEEGMVFIGNDLAVKTHAKADKFASVTIKIDKAYHIWVLAFFEGRLRPTEQTTKIVELGRTDWPLGGKAVRVGIEANAYQDAQVDLVREAAPDVPVIPIITSVNKEARAWRLATRTEAHQVHFLPGTEKLIEQLVLMPDGKFDDGFDALDLALAASHRGSRRKVREREPGLIGGSG